MEHREFVPPEELQDTIKCFWHNRRDFGNANSLFEVMPDGYAEIIFHFGGGLTIFRNEVLQPLPSPFLIGLLNNPVVFFAKNKLDIIAVRCFPWTVFDLLGLPSGKEELRLFEHPMAALQPALSKWVQENKIEEAINMLTQYFVEARSRIAASSLLSKAGVAMRNANGSLRVNQVAAAANATVRTLERKFKESSGYSVKDVSGLIRFEQVRNQLWQNPDSSLAGLAHELGYTDQSHLSREFKRYSGITPGAFARKAKKGRPSAGEDFVAFVQA